jgi:uncharacterized protein
MKLAPLTLLVGLALAPQRVVDPVLLALFNSGESSGLSGSTEDGTESLPDELFQLPDPWQKVERVVDEYPLVFWGAVGGAGLLVLRGVLRYLRNRPRTCKRCHQKMIKLGEAEDDAHLTSAQRMEETLDTVDYDVWMCEGCQNTLKLRYDAFFAMYTACERCKAKTVYRETTTVAQATQSSTGKARVDEHCRNCGYSNSRIRTIPHKPSPTRSSRSHSSF